MTRMCGRRTRSASNPPRSTSPSSPAGIGAVYGLIVSLISPGGTIFEGPGSFGIMASIGAGVVAAIAAGIGYWRARLRPGEEWRLSLPAWKYTVNTISVVIAHTALAFLATYAIYRVLSLGLRGPARHHLLGRSC